ncbi:murein biosynthesis integral membrane protein MurJ, partial [candidate division WWE3 bacterium RBG_19FT_COMBO_34_6]
MLKTYKNILNKTQQTILSAAFILAVASGINAVLGFVKGRLLATYFGDSKELAIFYTADRIPDLIYSVLVVGALSTIFIPVFTSIYKKDKARAWQTASSLINITLAFFVILAFIIFFLAPYLMHLLSVGKFSNEELRTGSDLMRIMLLSQLILVVSSFITSILQSFKYFLIPALAPIAYNIGLIIGIVLLSDKIGIFGPAIGVAIGAVLHLLVQLPILKNVQFDFIPFNFNFHKNGAGEVFKLMPSRIGSVLINNLIMTINNSLAILISASAVVHLKFANQLQFFPVNIFGFSIAHACLPTLSEESGDDDGYQKFKNTFITSFHQMMFLVIPTSVILLVLRVPIVRIVFGAAEFPWEATVKTSYALAFFSLSIFAQSGIYLVTRAFYALKDTNTPVRVGSLTLIINVLISLIFVNMFKFGVWSIAFSFTITSILNFISLTYLIIQKIGGVEILKLVKPFTKISYAAIFMGAALYIPLKLLDQIVFDTTRTINLLLLTGIASLLGVVTYLFLTWIFRVEEIELLYKLARKLKIQKGAPVVATSSIGPREEIED